MVQILSTEIDFRMDAIPDGEIDPLKEHGVRDIDMDRGHGRIYLDFKLFDLQPH
jgi:hypothetical protein